MSCRLSVNLNKVALIRNARGANYPDLIRVTRDCERFGAEGITVHPRPDERHIRYNDLEPLKEAVRTEFNVEGYPSEKFLNVVCNIIPHQVTLVPDEAGALTSDHGWKISSQNREWLIEVINRLKEKGIRVSLFVDPNPKDVEEISESGADRIELYTGPYAKMYSTDPPKAIEPYLEAAKEASNRGLGINAGHDLNLQNLRFFKEHIDHLLEVSIGHALTVDALYYGLENVIRMYKWLLR